MLGKLCCQAALGTQLLPLCKYSWGKESRNTDKMEQALNPEDILSCLLVLSTATPAGHSYWAGLAPISRVLAAKLPVSAWPNCWKRLRWTKCSNFPLSKTIQHLRSILHSREWGESRLLVASQRVLGPRCCVLWQLQQHGALGGWCAGTLQLVRQGWEALVLLLSVLQLFEIKYCLFSYQIQVPAESPQFSVSHQNHKASSNSCIEIGHKLMQRLCSYTWWMRQEISNL